MENVGFNRNLSLSKQCDAQDAIASVLFDIAHEQGGFESFKETNPASSHEDYVNWATGEALTTALTYYGEFAALNFPR